MSGQNSTTDKKDQAKTAAPVEAAPAVEAIEEDDEFEEFEPCHWDVQDEDAEDAQQWQVRQYCINFLLLSVDHMNCSFSTGLALHCIPSQFPVLTIALFFLANRIIGTMMILRTNLLNNFGLN
jgi:hypothetical protein